MGFALHILFPTVFISSLALPSSSRSSSDVPRHVPRVANELTSYCLVDQFKSTEAAAI
jgi:hypothetical protein